MDSSGSEKPPSGDHDGDLGASDGGARVGLVVPGDRVELCEEIANEAVLPAASLGHGDVMVEDREVDGAVIGSADGADQGAGAVIAEGAGLA